MPFGSSDFDTELEWLQQQFEREFQRYWCLDRKVAPEGIDADAWRSTLEVQVLADKVAKIAQTLLQRKGVGTNQLNAGIQLAEEAKRTEANVNALLEIAKKRDDLSSDQLADLESVLESPGGIGDPRAKHLVFSARLQLNAHNAFNRAPSKMAKRLQRLVHYLVKFPGDRANSYLARVAECFVLDLRTEFAVMTRAVLDTAIEDLVPDDEIRSVFALSKKARVDLSDRLAYCENHRSGPILPGKEASAARRIQKAGGDAAHVVVGLEPDPEDLLSDLATCLAALDRNRK